MGRGGHGGGGFYLYLARRFYICIFFIVFSKVLVWLSCWDFYVFSVMS